MSVRAMYAEKFRRNASKRCIQVRLKYAEHLIHMKFIIYLI